MKRKNHDTGHLDFEKFQDEEDSNVDEEVEEEIKNPGKKRNVMKNKQPKAVGVIEAVKLSKRELYKTPTNEELSQLKETENLFHSALLRMQVLHHDKTT
ncbi:nucleolar protein 6-like [Rhincodon typus]|uniref:nucleolar protein 6-like n=1 Tax=Rhincodon typus TaxID=259920 RepID=UPI00202EC2A3|nr:nucleolar protein 6-like [Rhincodon typus]